jgi:winged helix domain-containing protein/ATPase family protein associated with various cellular activities (AAA)
VTAGSASLRHLLARLALVEARVRRAVDLRRADDPNPDDPFRGLYLTDEMAARLLAAPDAPLPADPGWDEHRARVEADADAVAGESLRLRELTAAFGLDPLEIDVLLVALAPDLDARFEKLYGYLNDDVTRRRATVGLALELCGKPAAAAGGRAVFAADSQLVRGGLLVVEEPDRPFLSRSIRVPDRVTAHLLGSDRPDPLVGELLVPPPPPVTAGVAAIRGALECGAGIVYLREKPGAAGLAAASRATPRPPLLLDLRLLAERADAVDAATIAVREARLAGVLLAGGPVDAVAERPDVVRALTAPGVGLMLAGTVAWDPAWSPETPLVLEPAGYDDGERAALWRSHLDGRATTVDPDTATRQFVLSPEQVRRAARAAVLRASVRGGPVTPADLGYGARAQNAVGLGRLARRIEPAVGWSDLVLPADTEHQLREIALRARHRTRVLDDWRMRPGGGRGRGITALFAGDSGTGKTMSAEVIAADLGLDLYTIDLSVVIDKYVGETEKNLERIFVEAAGVNGVLLFDEADALFGKRSEVRDAHDRYANVESAYLLQRMESFDGLALLATNLRANLDPALTRRLDLVVDFPMPDGPQRLALWDRCLGPRLPRAGDLDLTFCASAFELSGGGIRSAAVAAAYLAADAGRPVGTADLVAGVFREYRKLGRLTVEAEFGPYLTQLL